MSEFEEMMSCIDKIQQLSESNSHWMTRDEEDSIFYNSENLRTLIKKIYHKVTSGGGLV